MFPRRAEGINSQQSGHNQKNRAKAAKVYHATPSENSTSHQKTHL
jgi:hypothetical protein